MTAQVTAAVLRVSGWAPHRLAKDTAGQLWEFISYPWPGEGRQVLINVRVPGDPTTLRAVDAHSVRPEGRACLCREAAAVLGRDEFYYVDERNAWKGK